MRLTHGLNDLPRLLMLALLLCATQLQAAPTSEDAIRNKLKQARPEFVISSIEPSVVAGMYEVQLQGGPLLYAAADGDYFFVGDLFSVGVGGIVNIAEQRRDSERQRLIAAVAQEDMIVFSPPGKPRASVAVFTDVDCFYCQKLHQEVPALLDKGIEVRYLAYPRSGIGGESYRKIASAWCAVDRQTAMNKLKNRENIPENVCADNPVADQFVLGQQVGVRGTPALILESGQMLPGYLSADDLAGRMGIN